MLIKMMDCLLFCLFKLQYDKLIEKYRASKERLGYVRNPRSLMEGTETLCRDDIGDLLGSPDHL